MESWGTDGDGVPPQIYDQLVRNEPLAQEKIKTSQLVPPAERRLEEVRPVDIREIIANLSRGNDSLVIIGEINKEIGIARQVKTTNNTIGVVYEISSSGMFALDAYPNV